MFFEPVPSVERVVFIATPHRGSYRATGRILRLIRRLVRLPGTLVKQLAAVLTAEAGTFRQMSMRGIPTSVENMSPGHPFIRTLAASPIPPGVTAHSIIPVRLEGPLTGQTDGVVAYESAHIEGVASERIVRSGHSTQAHPETIEEVRRILREHAGAR
jgi:hypothetical protein